MQKRVFQAALAGLLHDIGKMKQRSRGDPWTIATGFDAKEDQLVPVHASWSHDMMEKMPADYRAIARKGVYHHHSDQAPVDDRLLCMLVELADKLSAGERADETEAKKKNPPQQLVTIFQRVSLDKKRAEPSGTSFSYLPLQPLKLDEKVLFPQKQVLTAAEAQKAYANLCSRLEEALAAPIQDGQTYLENLLGALQQAAWCVPSAYYHSIPDVSLYDHLRMTAALAACLADWEQPAVEKLLGAVKRDFTGKITAEDRQLLNEPAVLLVGGDISGIQDFIYTLTSKGAARTLRGRSFYLQLLCEAVLRFVLREIGVPYTNVIYSGGGHFYLLAPLSAAEKITQLRKEVTNRLLHFHGIELYLALEAAPVPANDFKLGEFTRSWQALHSNLRRAKQHRYSELGTEDLYAGVFKPQSHGGNQEDTCAVCGVEHEGCEKLDDEDAESVDRICPLCKSFEMQLGKNLPGATHVALLLGQLSDDYQSKEEYGFLDVLESFGVRVQLLGGKGFAPNASETFKAERAVVWSLGDDAENSLLGELNGLPAARILRYTVNQVPQKQDGKEKVTLSFEELAKAHPQGIERLGVLRMDVDNLGQIFQHGFEPQVSAGADGKNRVTLARLSTLSFQMGLFFEGWVKHLCEEQQFNNQVYAVYSGGDDLFLIAPWHLVPGLAQKIVTDFSNYTAGNPDLHISGGMAFIGSKYPVYQAAKDAGEAEEQAKGNPGKNSFSFLDQAWSWQQFADLSEKFTKLRKIVQEEKQEEGGLGGPQSILHLLRNLADLETKALEHSKGRPVWGRWMWMGDYQLTRMAEQYQKRSPEVAAEIQSILKNLREGMYRDIRTWGVAARWAQLWVRKSSDSKKEAHQ